MTDRTSVLQTVACLIEDARWLRQSSRLKSYSPQFLLDIRRELDAFNEELRQAINKSMQEKTGDLRPFIQDVRK
jgi:hypothetical protein